MKILVTGSGGLVGSRFKELYPQPQDLLTPPHSELDFLNPSAVSAYISTYKPEVILHMLAWTDVGAAEKFRGVDNNPCWRLNHDSLFNVIRCIDPGKTHLIHLSSDMVFPGTVARPGPYLETDQLAFPDEPLTVYGESKKENEQMLQGLPVTIARINKPVQAHPKRPDYLSKMLEMFRAGKLPALYHDGAISLSSIDHLCRQLMQITSQRLLGIFHLSSSDTTTPHHIFSHYVKQLTGQYPNIPTSSVFSSADPLRYPPYGCLDTTYSQRVLGPFPSCQETVDYIATKQLT